ncbi:hypothetical protein QQ020_21600 [Fulvivirgaceae bacterium BMA12]|uniref:Tetratricopeptide repeat protein n=1 Tax=Agaribacillus aureus TaxID=3051825 RepID=A0ABT8LAA2_9BACT|nr:hypothetical protein [Fulvivirgaceae bacterium BMA12]
MDERLKLLEKIDKFLKRTLKDSELKEFESAIRSDPELASKVELNRIVNTAIKNQELLKHKEDINKTLEIIKNISDTVDINETRHRNILSRNYRGIAASIAILIVLGITLYFLQQPQTMEVQVQTYLEEHYDNPTVLKGGDDSQGRDWIVRYNNKNYEEAKVQLEKLIVSDRRNSEANFYLGLCYLYQDTPDFQKAIIQFDKVYQTKNRYHEQALWFLSLTYFQVGDVELFKTTLKKIRGYKKREAEKLLERFAPDK